MDAIAARLPGLLDEIQRALFDDAVAFRAANSHRASSYDETKTT